MLGVSWKPLGTASFKSMHQELSSHALYCTLLCNHPCCVNLRLTYVSKRRMK